MRQNRLNVLIVKRRGELFRPDQLWSPYPEHPRLHQLTRKQQRYRRLPPAHSRFHPPQNLRFAPALSSPRPQQSPLHPKPSSTPNHHHPNYSAKPNRGEYHRQPGAPFMTRSHRGMSGVHSRDRHALHIRERHPHVINRRINRHANHRSVGSRQHPTQRNQQREGKQELDRRRQPHCIPHARLVLPQQQRHSPCHRRKSRRLPQMIRHRRPHRTHPFAHSPSPPSFSLLTAIPSVAIRSPASAFSSLTDN
jgi:hypothetical protein